MTSSPACAPSPARCRTRAPAAFSVFFTQCPSFLSFQRNMERSRARNNARSLFQVERIPTDHHLRQTLDSVAPEHLMELFDDLHRAFEAHGLLPAMRAVQNTRLLALDATWYFSSHSENIHCPSCSCQRHADGRTSIFTARSRRSSSARGTRWLAAADYQLIRGKVGARRTFFEPLRALTPYLHFENWTRLMDFMMRGLEIGPHATAKS